MKGKVIMRFVGNRQEPEEHPVEVSFWLTSKSLWIHEEKFLKDWDEWFRHAMARLTQDPFGRQA